MIFATYLAALFLVSLSVTRLVIQLNNDGLSVKKTHTNTGE
jgi:hypothetical protein